MKDNAATHVLMVSANPAVTRRRHRRPSYFVL